MLTLITGGAGNGKSAFAESLAARLPRPLAYIAAMKPYGEESQRRIARHREARAGKGFITYEKYTALDTLSLPTGGTALLECVCNLTANEMFDEQFNERDGDSVFASVLRGIDSLAERCAHLVVVTNDVGGDTGGYNQSTMRYVELLGRINRALAKRADTVYELVCGIPLPLKGGEA